MLIPFKTQPKPKAVPVGDEATGIIEIPVKLCLTVNEQMVIDERTAEHKDFRFLVLSAGKAIKRISKLEYEAHEVGNAVMAVLNVQDVVSPHKEELNTLIDSDPKVFEEIEKLTKAVAQQANERRGAYVEAAMKLRLGVDDWQFEWGVEPNKCPDEGWNALLAEQIYGVMLDDEQSRRSEKEVVTDGGFTAETAKKSLTEEASQRELIGSIPSG